MKTLLIILDGLADRRFEALGGRTPLEAASTPNLDSLAQQGSCGTMYTVAPGVAPSSDQAHFVLFGNRLEDFPGRGYIEALGEGMAPAEGEIALRTSFVTVEERDSAFCITNRKDPRGPGEEPPVDLGGAHGCGMSFLEPRRRRGGMLWGGRP